MFRVDFNYNIYYKFCLYIKKLYFRKILCRGRMTFGIMC